MPLTTGDINFYGSFWHPDSDSIIGVGGVINSGIKVIFTDISANDKVEILSSSASDTGQYIAVSGRDSAGIIQTENIPLSGTGPVTGVNNYSRILKIGATGVRAGTVTVRKSSDDVTIATIPTQVNTVRRLFINATANASGGAAKQFYEKIFIRNDNLTTALLNATLAEASDPLTTVEFALESGQNGNNSGTGRVDTVPNAMNSGSFDSLTKNFVGTNLPNISGMGVWIRMTVAGGATPTGTTYSLTVNGASA